MTMLSRSIIRLKIGTPATYKEYDASDQNPGLFLTLSDHSRSPLSMNYEIIENSRRMVDGTMRRYVVSKKKTFSCSWEMLPTIKSMVADGNADALDMKSFYEKYCFSPINLSIIYGRNGQNDPAQIIDNPSYSENLQVFWTSFNYDIVKRYKNFDYWNISAEFTEI